MKKQCTGCVVSAGTHKPAEALHQQIDEPAAPVGQPIEDAIDALVWSAFTEGGCSEHRMSEARIQTELRKKELCTLIASTQPAAQGIDARQWLQQRDFEALERFAETSEDDESYDIGKEAVQRLSHFGCLNSHGFGRYSITAFGSYVLNNWSLARELPFKMQSERDAEHRAALAAQAKQGGAA